MFGAGFIAAALARPAVTAADSAPGRDRPRVVSLAPSVTATLDVMGAADRLVGATTHCDVDRPVVGGWLTPDYDRVADRDPDLVCTCDALQADVRDELRDRGHRVRHFDPATLPDVVETFEALGAAVGRPDAGEALADRARERLARVRARVPDARADRPVVYCEEWSDPPMAAGNWVPEAVETAGGRYPFVAPGERSRRVDADEVPDADPDHVVLHVCGRGTRADAAAVRDRWDVTAPVHVVDDSLLNQPSPALIRGVERLAELLHGVPSAAGDAAADD
jgi:iron complex transport system substrate-binding protein